MFANINQEFQSENIRCCKPETLEERYARLQAQKERSRLRRSKETPDQRYARLEAEKYRARQKRSRETPEARALRLETEKLRARKRRGSSRDQFQTFDYMKHILNDSCSIDEASFMTSLPTTSAVKVPFTQERLQAPAELNTDLYNLHWSEFSNTFCGNLVSFLENQELVDVTIAANGGCIQAHKLVLSISSQYFRDLFKMNPCKHPIVILKDVDYDTMNNLLQFMYCGEVKVAADKLSLLLNIAEMLQIKGLVTGNKEMLVDTPVSNSTLLATESPKSLNIKIPIFKKQTYATQTESNQNISNSHDSVPSNVDVTILQEGSQRLEENQPKRGSNATPSTPRKCDPPPSKRTRYQQQENVDENTYDLPKNETTGDNIIQTIIIKSENINNDDESDNFEMQLLPNLIKEEMIFPNEYICANIQQNGLDTGPGYS